MWVLVQFSDWLFAVFSFANEDLSMDVVGWLFAGYSCGGRVLSRLCLFSLVWFEDHDVVEVFVLRHSFGGRVSWQLLGCCP